jgi:hypothetical protein
MDAATAAVVANEARRNEARREVAREEGAVDATARLATEVSKENLSAGTRLAAARARLAALEAAGPGVTDDFGPYSTIDQAMQTERYAGKAAAIEYVKANPACTEADAVLAYQAAAIAARPPDRQYLLQMPDGLLREYRELAAQLGLTPDATWESFRALLVATPADELMAM